MRGFRFLPWGRVSMPDNLATLITETWAKAANMTSSHQRDYFLEALKEMQRDKEKESDSSHSYEQKR
jgi:hypothetical protein